MRFETAAPDRTPARLDWFEEALGLCHDRLVKLSGISNSADQKLGWEELATSHPVKCAQLEDLLGHFLEFFAYNWPKAREFLRSGRQPPDGLIPALAVRDTGVSEDDVLLVTICNGGEGRFPALVRYLAKSLTAA